MWAGQQWLAQFALRRASAVSCLSTALALTASWPLVMTKERAVAMAEPSVLPQRNEFQRVEMAQLSNELAHPGIDAGAIIEQ